MRRQDRPWGQSTGPCQASVAYLPPAPFFPVPIFPCLFLPYPPTMTLPLMLSINIPQ